MLATGIFIIFITYPISKWKGLRSIYGKVLSSQSISIVSIPRLRFSDVMCKKSNKVLILTPELLFAIGLSKFVICCYFCSGRISSSKICRFFSFSSQLDLFSFIGWWENIMWSSWAWEEEEYSFFDSLNALLKEGGHVHRIILIF